MELVITLATIPAIVALVNLLKKLGITGTGALVAAVVLGVALSMAEFMWAGAGWYSAASSGLLLGLAAAGLYDLAPSETGKRGIED